MTLNDSIPEKWNSIIKKNYKNAANLITHDHHLIKRSRVITLHKWTSTAICSILILKFNKPSSNTYFENLSNDNDIDMAAIYMLPPPVTHNTYVPFFRYKILNNVLFLNKKLHISGIKSSTLCSFCKLWPCLWSDFVQCFQNTYITNLNTTDCHFWNSWFRTQCLFFWK